MNKNQIAVVVISILIIIASAAFIINRLSSPTPPNIVKEQTVANAVPVLSPSSKVLTTIDPLKAAAPAVNPLEKTNPFKTNANTNAKNPFQ